MSENGFHIRLTTDGNDFSVCSETVEDFCERNDLSPKLVFKITLVLDEIITNIIDYGYVEPGSHTIDVYLDLEGTVLTIVVIDDAAAFNPLEVSQPELEIPLEERKRPIGGMGIHLVRSITDSLAYERKDDRNVLTMTINVAQCM